MSKSFCKEVNAMLSQRCVDLGTARSVIRELFEYGKLRAKEVGADRVFDFSIGNPSVPPPHEVQETLARLLTTVDPLTLHGYTSAQGDLAVREQLAASLSKRFGHEYTASQLYLTVGAAAALCCVFHALTVPGDEYILFAPYFPEYKVFIEGAGARVNILPPQYPDFQIDLSALEAAVNEHTKAVLINSPNNPSGAVYTPETLNALGKLLEDKSRQYGHPIYLISDEPYRELTYDSVTTPWTPDFYRDTIVCYSYSKSLSLPGERIGYVLVGRSVTDSETVYAAVAGAGRTLGYVNAPSLFQRVAAACDGLRADVGVYAENRRLLTEELGKLGYDTAHPPQGTFYYFLPTLEPDDVAFCQQAKALDLLLVPGSGFGAPGYARLSFCVPTDRIRGAIPGFHALAQRYGR